VWDVGAHIGAVTLRAMCNPLVSEVHAFEPNPAVADLLQLHVGLSRGAPVHVHHCALDQESGEARLAPGPTSNTGLSTITTSGSIVVPTDTIDRLVFEGGVRAPTLLKVDVEGAELRVLRGAARLLRQHPPSAIVIEAGDRLDPDSRALVEGARYSVTHIQRPDATILERENYVAVLGGKPE
jgi:FkbM family methyltransferase